MSTDVTPSDPPGVALQDALNAIVLRSLDPVFGGLAALHALFCVLDPLLSPAGIGRMTSQGYWAAACVVVFAGLRQVVLRGRVPPAWAHPLAALAAAGVLGRVIDGLRLIGPDRAVTDPALFLVGAGCFVLSRRWLFGIGGAVLASWLAAAATLHPEWTWPPQALFQLTAAATLAALVHEVRLRTYSRFIATNAELEGMHFQDQRRQEAQAELTRTLRAREAELRKHHQLVDSILKNAPIAVFQLDAAGTVLEVLGAGLERFGLAERGIGRSATELFPETEPQVRDALAGESVRFDLAGTGPNGTWAFDCFLTADRVSGSGAIGIATDITDRKRAEASQRETDEMLQQFAHHSNAVLFIKDLEGRYVFVSKLYEDLFHVTNELMRGRTDFDLFPRDVAEELRVNDREVAATGKHLTREERVPNDGEWRDYLSIKFPLKNGDGTVRAVCGIATDITGRKREEERLARRETTLRRFTESAVMGVIIGNFDGGITDANDEFLRMLGYQRSDLPLRWDAMTPPEHLPKDLSAIAQMKLSGVCRPYEKEFLRRDGSRLPILIGAGMLDEVGNVVVCFVLDYSERKRAEQTIRDLTEQLDQASRIGVLGEIATGISHELHQPLAVIAAYAQSAARRLNRGALTRERALKYFDEIASQALRAGDIIDRVRSLVKKREPVRRPTDANAVIAGALRLIQLPAHDKSVRVVFEPADGLPIVEADEVLLSQAIVNLAMNAIQALAESSGTDRRLTIGTLARPDGVEIIVRDNGPGLPEAVRSQLFRQFVTTRPQGLGLGLAMVKSIADVHGGELWAGTPPGGGCEFHLVLPTTTSPLEPMTFRESLSDESMPAFVPGEVDLDGNGSELW